MEKHGDRNNSYRRNIDSKRIDCANDVVSFALQTEKQRKSP